MQDGARPADWLALRWAQGPQQLMLGAGPASAQVADRKPNIVFILADNLGYGELGAYGGGILRGAPTPRIDALASEGMRLLNFNVEAQCTPSRSALLTGRFAIRSGTYEVPIGGGPDGLTLVGGHHRGIVVGAGLRHRNLGQVASRQFGRTVSDEPGI